MRLILLYNPVAGAGRARAMAETLGSDLEEAGHEVRRVASLPTPVETWLDPIMGDEELLVVVGGDGAMRLAAGPAVRAGTPVYHVPLGTENLFARAFGSDRSPARLVAAIEARRLLEVDVGDANGEPFLLMASAGFDAVVTHDLAARRGARISHLSYAGPILRAILRWRAPTVRIDVDGVRVVDGERGFVVIGNARQYAMRLDPARRASMTDGMLDAVFFPTPHRRSLVAWAVRCGRGTHVEHPGLVYRTGAEVLVRTDPPQLIQIDGDPMPTASAAAVATLRATVRPRSLRVLLPPAPSAAAVAAGSS